MLSVTLPIRTISESNSFEHWRYKHIRHKRQKQLVHAYLDGIQVELPCQVTLTRISPRKLDSDNLVTSFKWIRDAVAEIIKPGLRVGRADDDIRFTWHYMQEKGNGSEYAIRILID